MFYQKRVLQARGRWGEGVKEEGKGGRKERKGEDGGSGSRRAERQVIVVVLPGHMAPGGSVELTCIECPQNASPA